MKKMFGLAVVMTLGLATSGAPQSSSYGQWGTAELRAREAGLSKKVAADHSSRETLADYGNHRFRLLYRDADGLPEQHDGIIDVVIVQTGEGTLQLGGTMVGKRAGSGPGEYLGDRLDGGERHPIKAGDIVHIPNTVPHSFLVASGSHITYVLVKFPAK